MRWPANTIVRTTPWVASLLLAQVPSPAVAGEPIPTVRQEFRVGQYTFAPQVPQGYVLELLNHDMRAPRMISFAADGSLFVGSRSGAVYRLEPPYRRVRVVARLRGYPHSVLVRGGELLVANTDGIYRTAWDGRRTGLSDDDFRLWVRLPGGSGHDSRTLRQGPDGRLYVSLGIQGNCSDQYLDDARPFRDRRGGLFVVDESGAEPRLAVYASGLRNPVGFDWQPGTGALYASNNGPDHLGFEQPPEVFVKLSEGSFHGMPWFQFDGREYRRDGCVASQPPRPASQLAPPAALFPARNAPMAVAFVPAAVPDPRLRGDVVVALRGSWGTPPDGSPDGDPAARRQPALVRLRFQDGQVVAAESLVTGFQLEDGRRWARPVGVAFGPDGALYFTSDSALQGLYRLRPEDP